MLGALTHAGFEITMAPEDAQVLVVNTCAFIEAAKKESIDAILQAAEVKKRAAGRRLVVAGCLSQRYGDELREMLPEVDVFVGTGNFLDLPDLLRATQPPEQRPAPYRGAAHLLPAADAPRITTTSFFSTYLKVSEGCNHKCAFCIIPKIRGPHESRPVASIVEEAAALAARGVREFNLIAQDLTAYGRDLNPPSSLARLLRELARVEGCEMDSSALLLPELCHRRTAGNDRGTAAGRQLYRYAAAARRRRYAARDAPRAFRRRAGKAAGQDPRAPSGRGFAHLFHCRLSGRNRRRRSRAWWSSSGRTALRPGRSLHLFARGEYDRIRPAGSGCARG